MMKKLFFLYSIILFAGTAFSVKPPVLVMTHAYLRPDFIEIQYKTLKKFLKDDYTFVVFNDARHPQIRQQIQDVCNNLQLTCIEIPQQIHDTPYLFREAEEDLNNPCARCANVIQYSLDTVGFKHEGIVAILDSDLFLIRDFSISEYMTAYDIAGISQQRGHINYLWNGIVFFNMQTLPEKESINFNCGFIEGYPTDVGGHTYYYFKKHPQVRISPLKHIHSEHFSCTDCKKLGIYIPCIHSTESLQEQRIPQVIIKFIQSAPDNMETVLNHTFLHYRGGGNWDQRSCEYHTQKTMMLNNFIKDLLSQESKVMR